MAAPKIAAVATATPPWRYDQATVLRMSGYDDPRRMGFFNNSLIEARHLYVDPETFTPDESVDQLNARWQRGAVEIATAAVERVIERAGWDRRRGFPGHHHLHGARVPQHRRAGDPRAGAQALHPARARGRQFRSAVVRLLRQVLVPEAVGLVDVELVIGLGRGLTGWLTPVVAMRQVLFDFLLVMETVGWVRPVSWGLI